LSGTAIKPRNLAIAGRELAVAWGDGHESYIPMEILRRHCPCAHCKERSAAPTGDDGPTIARLVPVGAYAVQIVWSDGHDLGIHTYESLRQLCPCPDCVGV
jgi:DUF971 family protein